jgi:hypothetical protein
MPFEHAKMPDQSGGLPLHRPQFALKIVISMHILVRNLMQNYLLTCHFPLLDS